MPNDEHNECDGEFAVAVRCLVRGRSTKPLNGKIAIIEAYLLAVSQGIDGGMFEQFKTRLAAAAREGLIERCDVVGVLPSEILNQSRLPFGRDERHLIVS